MRLDEYLYGKPLHLLRKWFQNNNTFAMLAACIPKISSGHPLDKNVTIASNERFIGLEFEIEGVHVSDRSDPVSKIKQMNAYEEFCKFWRIHTDGSLRNSGREFISNLGLTLSAAPKALKALEESFKLYFDSNSLRITSRCSVHVHYNIWDYTFEELRSLVFVYMVLENALFQASGNRSGNIFCVPANKLPRYYWMPISTLFNKKTPKTNWNNLIDQYYKYAGLNLLPISEYGTIEFRHHEGTLDTSRILGWLTIINEVCETSRIHSTDDWLTITKEAWEENKISDLVEFISPTLYKHLKGINLHNLIEPSVKYAFWAFENQNNIVALDDDTKITNRRKKEVTVEEFSLDWDQPQSLNTLPNNF